jgi:hypothetical protein
MQSCLLPSSPSPPTGLEATQTTTTSVDLTWDPHPDFETGWGYKVYYDTDSDEPPYTGTGLNEGISPVNVGDVTQYTLTGLDISQDYYFAVTVFDDNGFESGYSNVVLVPGVPILQVSPAVMTFTTIYGGFNPIAQPLDIRNLGGGTLSWTASINRTWMYVDPASGTAPASPNVLVAANDLHIGRHQGQITIDAGTAQNSPQSIDVGLAVKPNDPLFSDQWGLENIDVLSAWSHTRGANDVVIAVVDTGVNRSHNDLNNGKTLIGYNFLDHNYDTTDNTGHGTHVASIMAATTNNANTVAGICPECLILPLKVGSSDEDLCSEQGPHNVADAIRYATDNGAAVINMSLGVACTTELANAVNYAYEHDVTLVAGAGNNDDQGCPVKEMKCPVEIALALPLTTNLITA